MVARLRDPLSAISHYIGAGLSVVAIVVVSLSRVFGFEVSILNMVSTLVFTSSMFLLYMASGLYHSVNFTGKKLMIFRKIDHAMIYVLIAGSYTPFLLAMNDRRLGIILLIVIWSLALVGVLLKIFFFNMPRAVGTGMYIALGWLVVFFAKDIAKILPLWALILLAAGGISYSIGGIIYMLKKPSFKKVNFHDIFHFFVLGGTAAQFFSVYFGILLAKGA
ncbi:MAG: hemolysin III family protein [Peptostreptococcaceae bacterium]|nr:hemolysin III family protein [Peptostreptococcaceae bacterium]